MNIVINGGSRGIGREVALYLSGDHNNEIVATGRDSSALESLASLSSNIHVITTDLADPEVIRGEYPKKVCEVFQSIDILINMAGYLVSADFMAISSDDARKIMETNFFGPANTIRALQPLMHRGSHIVNVSSMGGYQGSVKFRGLAYYSSAKAAIACLSECLAVEFSELGISVNCLALGAVQTDMLAEAFPGYKAPVTAEEIAPFIAYFALNGNKFINGKIIPLAMSNP